MKPSRSMPPRPPRRSRTPDGLAVSSGLPDRAPAPVQQTRNVSHQLQLLQAVATSHPSNLSLNSERNAENSVENVSLTPRSAKDYFEFQDDLYVASRDATFRVYSSGLDRGASISLILLHGGGHCALSWSLVANKLKRHCTVIAFDARGHGNSISADENDFSAETQVRDAVAVVQAFFQKRNIVSPRVVLCGHSMGGAIAVRLAASELLKNVVGLVVIDVVEGTAMSALPYMSSWIQGRKKSFISVEKAISYVSRAGHIRNPESARVSVPPQVKFDETMKRWVWRTQLQDTAVYWEGWFQGLTPLFLSVKSAKMLVLPSIDRLDKGLMIGLMQGKFQNVLIPGSGHTVHEDQPDQTARVILDYLQRNAFLERNEERDEINDFQQTRPLPPCR